MSPLKPNQVADAETADSSWKGLNKVGGVAALIISGVHSDPGYRLRRLAAT